MQRGQWLVDQLPLSMLEDDFLTRFLGIFQEIADTFMVQVDNVEHVVDTTVAPTEMVRALGAWIGAPPIDPSLPDEVQRRIVRERGQMLQWRGTSLGLRHLLEMITDAPASIVDSGGVYAEGEAPDNPAHVRISVGSSGWTTDDELLDLVRGELPAAVSFELTVGDRVVWPVTASVGS
jgi:phage tail-like protein